MATTAKRGILKAKQFEPWQRKRIEESTFDELWAEANPTGQPGVRYHNFCAVWLEKQGTVKLSAVDTYPEDMGRILIEGVPPSFSD
jgi:hypothetical protein